MSRRLNNQTVASSMAEHDDHEVDSGEELRPQTNAHSVLVPDLTETQDAIRLINQEIAVLSLKAAMGEIAVFWPFVFRYIVFAVAQASKSGIISQKNLEWVAVYAAHQAVSGVVAGFLYGNVFPVVTLCAAVKKKEDEALEEFGARQFIIINAELTSQEQQLVAEKKLVAFQFNAVSRAWKVFGDLGVVEIETLPITMSADVGIQRQDVTLTADKKALQKLTVLSGCSSVIDLEALNSARKEMQIIWRQGVFFTGVLSGLALVYAFKGAPLFRLFGQSELVQEYAPDVLKWSSFGFVADIAIRLMMRLDSGIGFLRAPLIADGFDQALEVALGYILLNGKFGLPEMGLSGMALAYSASKVITALLHLLYMATSPKWLQSDFSVYHFFSCEGAFLDGQTLKRLVYAGFCQGAESVASRLSSMVTVMFCGHSGSSALVGIQAAAVFQSFAEFHLNAVLTIASNKIGQYYEIFKDEENKYSLQQKKAAGANAVLYTKILLILCLIVATVACGLAFAIPQQLVGLFIDENRAEHQDHFAAAVTFIKIQGVAEIPTAIYQASGCTLIALFFNLFASLGSLGYELGVNTGCAAGVRYGMADKDASWVFGAAQIGFVFMAIHYGIYCRQKLTMFSKDPEAEAQDQVVHPEVGLLQMEAQAQSGEVTGQSHGVMQRLFSWFKPSPVDNHNPNQPLLNNGQPAASSSVNH